VARDNHTVANKPAYIAVGVDTDGEKHVLGIWLAKTPWPRLPLPHPAIECFKVRERTRDGGVG
jgi:hypothetical protein